MVQKLSSSEVSIDAKKKYLVMITKSQLTEVLVCQLFSSRVLVDGVKCVLQQFMDNTTNFRREVLVLALQFFNQCLAFTRSSGRVRSLLWENSKEMIGGGGGPLLIQYLVTLCDPVQVEARIDKQVCMEITSELRNVSVGVMIGKIVTSHETKEQVGKWAKVCLGTTREEVIGSMMVQQMFNVMELCFVQDGHEVRMEKLLVEKYPDHIWSVKHPVKEEIGAGWSTVTVVKLLPSGYAMVYTDMDWEDRLARLEQELQQRSRIIMPGVRVKPGVLACINWSDLKLNNEEITPLVRCQVARVIVLSDVNNQGMVDVFMIDHGCKGTISASTLSLLPHHLCTLTPCIVLSRVQGILPSPVTDLLTPALQALSYITNSRTVTSLLARPSLASARIISQLLYSPQAFLLNPALSVLHSMVSTMESRKHILLSPVCLQLLVPSLIHLLTLPGLPSNQQSLVMECLLALFTNLPHHQVLPFYHDGALVDSLAKVGERLGESRHSDLVSRLLCLGNNTGLTDKQIHHSETVKEARRCNPDSLDQDDVGCLSRPENSFVQNNFLNKERDLLLSHGKINKIGADCFIPLQVQSQAAMRRQCESSSPARKATEKIPVSNSSKVSHVKPGPNLPSWLGGSSCASDDSSDSDTDEQPSIPPWIRASSMDPV